MRDLPTHPHGGSLSVGRRKRTRAIDLKRPVHLVLRASRARGRWSLLHPRNKVHVHLLLERFSDQFGIKIYRFVNVGNHLHILARARRKRDFQDFLRAFAGALAMKVTGARKGRPVGRFWDLLAFTRLVNWGRDFVRLTAYFVKNSMEALGAIDRYGADAGLRIFVVAGGSPQGWRGS